MEIVPAETEQSKGLICPSSSNSVQLSQDQIELLRRNREAHRYNDIWTKDYHAPRGGYKKAKESNGIDVFKQNLDGSEKQVELGFERVELGPTTNFVGNAMTTGAVDMVQALLQFRRKTADGAIDERETQMPKLLNGKEEIEEAAAAAARARREVESASAAGLAGPMGALLPSTQATSSAKTLRIVEWKDDADRTIVLLERPYAEDVSWEMTLHVSIEPTVVLVEYVMTSRGGARAVKEMKEMKRYRREMKDFTHSLDVDRCRCHLGSGSLDELLASSSVDNKNKKITVPHSDESTVICLVLQKDPSGSSHVANGETDESRAGARSLALAGNSADEAKLNALKSLIRRTRKS